MIKKIYLFLMMVALVLGTMLTVSAQDDSSSYNMWEDITITPDYTKLKVFGENMRKHNQTYHPEGTYKAFVFDIVTGPNTGKLVWIMGPITFSNLDGRPSAGGHDDDWRDNIMPYVKKMTNGEYWKQMDELSNVSMLDSDNSKYPILHLRYFEVEKGQGYNIDGLLKQMSEAVKAMEGENPWGLYSNEFRQGYAIGRHIAWISFHKNWAEFDDDNTFKESFINVHGDDAWQPFIRGMDDTFSDSWDEIWVYNKELSGQ